jgi:DNA-binding transcriptional ArsR family regulator
MDEIRDMVNIDRLVHEPARLAIMAVLSACTTADFAYLLNATGLGKGNLSSHLTRLKEAGYISITKGFKGNYPNTSCALTAKGQEAFNAYRKRYLALVERLDQPLDTALREQDLIRRSSPLTNPSSQSGGRCGWRQRASP